MAWVVLLAVIAVPVAEIAVFIKMAQGLGVLSTVALAILGAMAGMALVRAQGLRTMLDAHTMMDQGQMPMAEMFDAVCLSLAGALLILPGFLSDLLALALLVPVVRAWLRNWLAARLIVNDVSPGARPGGGPTVIDGDYTVIEPTQHHLERD